MLPVTLLAIAVITVAEPPTDPRKYLDWWYEQLKPEEDKHVNPRDLGAWNKQFKQLASKKPEDREAAVKFLCDVAALSLANEAAGKAPHRDRYSVNEVFPSSERASTLALMWRAMTLHYFRESGDAHPELFPLVAWYLESETEVELHPKAMVSLDTFTTADADKLRLKLAAGTHPNAVVVAHALKQLPKHKQKLPADELLALCHHHRKQVREAARELNKAQGGKDPGPFDPVKAMQSPPVKALLAELEKWTPDAQLPAKDAKLVEVTARYLDADKKEQKKETHIGWLIEKKGNTVRLLLPGGYTDEFTHGEKGSLHVYATSYTPVTRDVSISPANVKTLVEAIAEVRKEMAEEAQRRPFDSPGLSRAEVFAGAWLLQTGHAAEAAAVLLPALDAHDSDQYLLDFARQEIGEIIGGRMEVAFAERDYAEALKLARRIDTVYPATEYHPQARRFLDELPKRLDDFKTFTLPTPEEWRKLKGRLSHDEQVEYLASRLRLLRMTPGYETRVVPQEAQFADAERKQPLVNPYSELVGGGPVWYRSDIPATEGMKLTVKDIPVLAKHLKDDWLTLCAGYTRFNHSRTTRGLLRGIINHLADHNLCATEFDDLTPKQIDAEVERITKWAKARETLSEVDLQWALYQQEKDEKRFGEVTWRMGKLLAHKSLSKERRAELYADLKQRYERDDGWTRHEILDLFLKYDPKTGLKLAEEAMAKGVNEYLAAHIVFVAGDKAKARPIMGRELANETSGLHWFNTLLLLLEDGTKESLAEAARLFDNKELLKNKADRSQALALCAKAGLSEPYRFYRERLDEEQTAERFADEIAKEFAKDDPDVKKIVADHPKAADQIPHLKKWLDAKLKAK